MENALGLIEVVGLAAGLEAADAAIKAANITLIGYELTKGGGMVVIKLSGDVGAVKAAVDAGSAAAAKIGTVYASHVIPRPGNGLKGMITTNETVGADEEKQRKKKSSARETKQTDESKQAGNTGKNANIQKADSSMHRAEVCNLCSDPACPRRKGEPKTTCIHYKES